MAESVRTPRVNNNDDRVKLSHVYAEAGSRVRRGDPIADVETDKATFTVESEHEGYVLAVRGAPGEMLEVGSILAWIGEDAGETVVETEPANPGQGGTRVAAGWPGSESGAQGQSVVRDAEKRPSLKRLLLEKQRAAAQNGEALPGPAAAGRTVPFTPQERGMLRTVSWHRDHAVPAYLDIAYDPAPWQAYAREFQSANGLWYDPLLALLCHRLAQLTTKYPRVNATVLEDSAYLYEAVNLGFTIQADATLYLAVIRDAGRLEEIEFARALSGLQMSAMRHELTPEQTADATVSFSSMARWNVTRHIPILPPHTALMVSHTRPANGTAHLGASYDHRLLTGFDVVRFLQSLSTPPTRS